MGRKYSISGTATNTQSATLPFITVIGTAAVRPRIYDVMFSSAATPADNAALYQFQRCTTAGTPGSSVTAYPLDSQDPAAVTTSGLATFGAGPTLTASTFVLSIAHNQRATVRWVAAPDGELVIPASANNGIAVMPTVVSSAFSVSACLHFQE